MTELWRMGAVELAGGIAGGSFRPSEVLASVIERMHAVNPRLNAITIDMTEEAIGLAEQADRAIDDGEVLGPLHGVPVTIKENVDVAGQPNTNGLPALADLIATEDAPLVRNLRDAGAIVFAMTNTPEFSMRATTDNPLRGRTVNPWDDQASAGGSSGGAGSACAAGFGPLHHGNDIGGSLRFPTSANGTCTVKPTSFRVPVYNATAAATRGPLAQAMSVQGVIARHAADVARATEVMVRPDPRDPFSPPVPWRGPDLPGPIKVAVTTESHGYPIHPEIEQSVQLAAEQLRDAGYEVVEVAPPPIDVAAAEWFRAGSTEMQVTLGPALEAVGSDVVRQVFGSYFELSEILDRDAYMNALGDRTRLVREWTTFLDDYPLVLTPFLMRPMYDHDYDAKGLDAVRDIFDAAVYSAGTNYLGLPTGVLATTMVEGRPSAVQLVGRPFREDTLCDALGAIEHRNGILAPTLWEREG